MLAHPWMKVDLNKDIKLNTNKNALSKYVSIRKEKSKKYVMNNDDDEEDGM